MIDIKKLIVSAGAACAGTAMFAFASPAHAGFPVEEQMTCAVGGEKFTFITTPSYTIFGTRADGKPFGSWSFPMALPDCPSNKLVMYRTFSEPEIAKLTDLIASDDYVALRAETTYYRASWLSAKLDGEGKYDHLWILLRATWQVDADLERKYGYQNEFAAKVDALEDKPDDLDWVGLQARAANALRETGDTKAALAMIAAIPLGKLQTDEADETEDAEARRYWLSYLTKLKAVTESGNSDSEPIAMMPPQIAAQLCDKQIEDSVDSLDPHCYDKDVQRFMEADRD